MHEFIRRILGGTRPQVKTIALDAVPSWAGEREQEARSVLLADTEEPVRAIRNAAAQLQLIVNSIESAEQDPELHPKLRSIAKNSLPLFVRAMNASLSKELPDDPEEFYTAAVECVKGCLNGSRGQGRYLQVVLPEEMKSIRLGIDTMGREINALTGILAVYRNRMQEIAAVRTVYATATGLKTDLARSADKNKRISQRIADSNSRLEAIGKEEQALAGDERQAGVAAKKDELAARAQARDETARMYSALSMTASHVFRKAEKIASRQHHPTEIAVITSAMDLLSSHDIPDDGELATTLAAACPVAERMVAAGDIVLKNKEERAIFSDVPQFCTTLCRTCRELVAREEEYRKAGEALDTDPLLMKIGSLGREKTQLAAMLEKEHRIRQDLEEWRAKTLVQIPALMEELRKKIENMEEGVQIQVDDRAPS